MGFVTLWLSFSGRSEADLVDVKGGVLCPSDKNFGPKFLFGIAALNFINPLKFLVLNPFFY